MEINIYDHFFILGCDKEISLQSTCYMLYTANDFCVHVCVPLKFSECQLAVADVISSDSPGNFPTYLKVLNIRYTRAVVMTERFCLVI